MSKLPSPDSRRWKPLRSGLVDLYKYDEQEFVWESGRLLLRGNNGTGKSRVLALQLPFLLDGEVAPHRLEPDGDPAKRIEWNLLLERYDRRLGYTWIEFGRRDEHGADHFLTLGCGLSAVRGAGTPRKWFFLTTQRVGETLHLQENRTALHKDRLRAAVGTENVYETVEAWQQAVDRALFRLGVRYRSLMDLLVQLRQPQLSRDLDEKKLSRALSMALPPLPSRVVEPLAEGFRALESDRAELDGFHEAVVASGEFLGRYRSYAGVAARRRAGRLRSTHAAYEDANRRALRARESLATARDALARARVEQEQAQTAEADANTRVQTLERAPAMDIARELKGAREAAHRAASEEKAATEALSGSVTREAQRRERSDGALRDRNDAEHAAEAARAALDRAVAPLGLAVEVERPAWDRAMDGQRRAAKQLEQTEDALQKAKTHLDDATRDHDIQRAHLDHAREDESGAAAVARQAGHALSVAFASWRPKTLELDAAVVLRTLEVWLDDPTGRGPIEAAVSEAERAAVAEVERTKAGLVVEVGQLRSELDGIRAEIERLHLGGHAPPALWPGRAREPGVPGAPLWALCDFREDVAEPSRRGIEAALEGAGLLDAWVTPTGELLPDGSHDAALTLDAPATEPSLASALRALDNPEVPSIIVAGVLARIGLGSGSAWVDTSGQYRLGPLRGTAAKGEVEHIGETAREAARQRRITELSALAAGLEERLLRLAEAVDACGARVDAIRAEARGLPDDQAVKKAAIASAQAREATTRAQTRLVEAEKVVMDRRRDEHAVRHARDELARDLGFEAWAGRPRELHAALSSVESLAVEHFAARRHLGAMTIASEKAKADHEEAASDLERDRKRSGEATRQRRDAEVHRDALQEAHGAEVGAILAAVEHARSAAHEAAKKRKAADETMRGADREEAGATAAESAATERADLAESERDAHVGAVRALVDTGLLAVLEVSVPDETWSTTRAVDLARRLEEVLSTVAMDDAAWSRVKDALHRDLEELRHTLVEHRWDPSLRSVDDLYVVEVSLGEGPLRLPALRERLADEVRTREAMLTAREREIIENHLVGELATELHELIHQGERLVREMSQEVEARATSTGMRLRFDWQLRSEVGPEVAEARKRLMRQGAAWSTGDRDLIAQFLKRRLDEARASDGGATWQQQIERAFDYREWHTFVVERHQDGQWKALTRRTHGTGSGGEKAIALTIPQLAAAAAYYRNADPLAPRLILLDEAFVGVDADMRAKCMGLFATFDLDFMMTSEREWACYATLPGVAICQLATAPGVDAIDVVRWVWNGRDRRPG